MGRVGPVPAVSPTHAIAVVQSTVEHIVTTLVQFQLKVRENHQDAES